MPIERRPNRYAAAVKRYRDMGNSAFQDQRYDDAITFYTQAINNDDRQYGCYSNRSAAYLRKGDLILALEDAGKCIEIKPTYHKGHIRRVAVYHKMGEFSDVLFAAYKEGLQYCPNDKTLRRGLQEAEKKKLLLLRKQQQQQQQDTEYDEEKVLKTFKF